MEIIKKSNSLKKIAISLSVILLAVTFFSRCAKIVAPNGGPRDTLAPVLVRSVPKMNSLNFRGNKITLTFDEYTVLKDIQKKLAISPPMIKKPEFVQRGRNIEVRLKEPLKENTTYTFYFSDAIVDNNEGNPLRNFVFAFSTGAIIDSLAVTGKIINAFTLLPEENAFVMLYDNQNDSVPIKNLPKYLSRSDRHGLFTFNNLQHKDYKVFALKDNNSNYKFDQISEDIAFLDTLLKKETLIGPSKIDTSRLAKKELFLKMFKENSRVQSLTGSSRSKRRKLAITFTKKPEGGVTLNPLNFKVDSSWFIRETNLAQDSLIYWITDNRISSQDTFNIRLSYLKSDSLQRLIPKLDTLKFIYVDKEVPVKRKSNKEKEDVKKNYLKVNVSVSANQITKPTKPFEISFPIPLLRLNDSLISLINLKDSSKVKGIRLEKDTLNPRLYRFKYSWVPDIPYRFEVQPGAFTSLDGLNNDTLKVTFKGANPENFGTLNITLHNVQKSGIIELLDDKRAQVIERKIAKTDEKVTFSFVDPGKYTLRFIDDLNGNGVWDTGWYLKGIQPEKVYNYDEGKTKGVLNIRANWENEITFDFAK